MATPWRLQIGGADDLDLLEPLWVAVHHRHREAMPELAPYVSDAETWRARRSLYEQLIDKPDTLLLIAFVGDNAVGYGLTHVLPVADSWIEDTWVTGERVGEIESLSVLPEYRGSGLAQSFSTAWSVTCMSAASTMSSSARCRATPTRCGSISVAAISPHGSTCRSSPGDRAPAGSRRKAPLRQGS
jgi:hypothetical protein